MGFLELDALANQPFDFRLLCFSVQSGQDVGVCAFIQLQADMNRRSCVIPLFCRRFSFAHRFAFEGGGFRRPVFLNPPMCFADRSKVIAASRASFKYLPPQSLSLGWRSPAAEIRRTACLSGPSSRPLSLGCIDYNMGITHCQEGSRKNFPRCLDMKLSRCCRIGQFARFLRYSTKCQSSASISACDASHPSWIPEVPINATLLLPIAS